MIIIMTYNVCNILGRCSISQLTTTATQTCLHMRSMRARPAQNNKN